MPIRSFTKSLNDPSARNEWVKYGTEYCMDVYIASRDSRIINSREWDHVLCIANIVIPLDRMRGKGEFRRFIQWAHQKAKVHGYDFVLIENITVPFLERALLRCGYKHIDEMHPLTPCMVFPISPEARNAFDERYYPIPGHRSLATNANGNRRSGNGAGSKRETQKRAKSYAFSTR